MLIYIYIYVLQIIGIWFQNDDRTQTAKYDSLATYCTVIYLRLENLQSPTTYLCGMQLRIHAQTSTTIGYKPLKLRHDWLRNYIPQYANMITYSRPHLASLINCC